MNSKNRGALLTISLIMTLVATAYFSIEDQSEMGDHTLSLNEVNPQPQTLKNITYLAPEVSAKRNLIDPLADVFMSNIQLKDEIEFPSPGPQISTPPPQPLLTPPTPPALPFTYIGKLIEGREIVVFLGLRGKNLAVKTGDTIQNTYRIEEIKPPLLIVTYIPMGIKQSIQIGETN